MKYAKEGTVATSMTKTFPVFDCDSHVVEPPAVWDEYVERQKSYEVHEQTRSIVLLFAEVSRWPV